MPPEKVVLHGVDSQVEALREYPSRIESDPLVIDVSWFWRSKRRSLARILAYFA